MKKDIFSVISEEEIKKIDCNNCKYAFYDPNDKNEYQKCLVMCMMDDNLIMTTNIELSINETVFKLINRGILGEFGCSACEYFDFK